MTDDADLRKAATKRLQAKQGFWSFLVVWVIVALVTTGIWWFTGGGYYWPGWVIGGMGIALIFSALNAFTSFNGPITEAKIDAEVRRMKGE